MTGGDRAGVVIDIDYRENDWPPEISYPYRVLLEDETAAVVPEDTDQFVWAAPAKVAADKKKRSVKKKATAKHGEGSSITVFVENQAAEVTGATTEANMTTEGRIDDDP